MASYSSNQQCARNGIIEAGICFLRLASYFTRTAVKVPILENACWTSKLAIGPR